MTESTELGSVLVLAPAVDDPAAALVAEVLGDAGAEVSVTDSPVDAAVAAQQDRSPTLVVTTPAPAATSLVSDLRSSTWRRQRDAAVVVVVDSADEADAALDAGADSVLIRPVEAERLVEAIAQLA